MNKTPERFSNFSSKEEIMEERYKTLEEGVEDFDLDSYYNRENYDPITNEQIIINEENRKADKRKIKDLEEEWSYQRGTDSKRRGNLVERFLIEEADRSEWLGALITPTSKFDDYMGGIDAVAEFEIDEQDAEEYGIKAGIFRLGIDITGARSRHTLKKKRSKHRYGTTAKYFRSQVEWDEEKDKPLETSLFRLPSVAIGFSAARLDSLEDFAEKSIQNKQKGKIEIHPQTYKEHAVQSLILDQIFEQTGGQLRDIALFWVNSLPVPHSEISFLQKRLVNKMRQIEVISNSSNRSPEWKEIINILADFSAHEIEQLVESKEQIEMWNNLMAVYKITKKKKETLQKIKNLKNWSTDTTHKGLSKAA